MGLLANGAKARREIRDMAAGDPDANGAAAGLAPEPGPAFIRLMIPFHPLMPDRDKICLL